MVNLCPVCGFIMQYPPSDHHICPSCGTEFGYDDAGRSHARLRAEWLRAGAHWWSPVDAEPYNWDPYIQLDNIMMGHSVWASAFNLATQTQPDPGLLGALISGREEGQASKLGSSMQALSGQGAVAQRAA
jgi:hypothetical protein